MESLFKSKRYHFSLFVGHLVLEKILKAHVVKNTKKEAFYSHDLVRLHSLTGISLDEKEVELLNMVNEFNIRARYPEYKREFYKRCTKKYAKEYLEKIIKLYKKLCQILKQKN